MPEKSTAQLSSRRTQASPARTITVPGEGRVSVRADVADLRVGIALTEPTVQAARTAGAVALNGVLSRLGTLGIKDREIRTSILSLTPAYDYSNDRHPPRLVGYALTNTVSVTVRDLERVADVVDGALTSGATTLDGIAFRVADPAPAQRRARELAVADARTRAETIAAAAGVEIESVAAISEGAQAPFEPYPAMRALAASDVATPIEAGMNEVAVSVTVTFTIR
jgi:uncharacterized protein YggE